MRATITRGFRLAGLCLPVSAFHAGALGLDRIVATTVSAIRRSELRP